MRHLIGHYRGKYPNGRTHATETSCHVYNEDGELCVVVEKNGHGIDVCASEAHQALHFHCLAPYEDKHVDKQRHPHFKEFTHEGRRCSGDDLLHFAKKTVEARETKSTDAQVQDLVAKLTAQLKQTA